eukprot:PhM_4_TR2279/c0_g1_i1/m.74148/K14863/YTM1, WDR12; ribosome biogenesis protein YTM1
MENETARVTFFTTRFDAAMPETTYTVPVRVLPAGMSELVNSVLSLTPEVPMDFFIDGEIVTKSLERYLKEHSNTKSREDVLNIEYAPALQYTVQERLPHDDWVSSVKVVNYQNGLLLSGCYDSNICLWHQQQPEAECLCVGQGHTGAVKEVCMMTVPTVSTTAGKKRVVRPAISNMHCASASKDGSVITWEYDTERQGLVELAKYKYHTEAVETVDHQHMLGALASGGWDNSIAVWRPVDGNKPQPMLRLKGHTRAVMRVRFPATLATNNATLLSTGLDGSLRVWDVSGGHLDPIRTFVSGHAAYGLAVRGNHEAATGHTDSKVRLWDSRTAAKATHVLKGHKSWIYSVAYCGEHRIVSCAEDCTVRLWDSRVPNGAMLVMDTQHGDGVLDLATAGPSMIATASKDNTVKLTEVK